MRIELNFYTQIDILQKKTDFFDFEKNDGFHPKKKHFQPSKKHLQQSWRRKISPVGREASGSIIYAILT